MKMKNRDLDDYLLQEGYWKTADSIPYPSDVTENSVHLYLSGISSTMKIRYGGDYKNGIFYDLTGVTIRFFKNKKYALNSFYEPIPKNVLIKEIFIKGIPNLQDLHKLVMAEEYVYQSLKHSTIDKARKSPLYDLKRKIEANLSKIKNGEASGLEFDLVKEMGEENYNKMIEKVKLEKDIHDLIVNKQIPPETKTRKYTRDSKKFHEELPIIIEKYEKYKNAIVEKARIKDKKHVLKLTQKEEKEKQRLMLKEQRLEKRMIKKQMKEDLKESVYGIDI